MDKFWDYIVAQMRESSTWRGLIDIGVGVGIFSIIAKVTFLSPELTSALQLIAMGFVARGGVAVAAKDTTKAGIAAKVETALDVIDAKAQEPKT